MYFFLKLREFREPTTDYNLENLLRPGWPRGRRAINLKKFFLKVNSGFSRRPRRTCHNSPGRERRKEVNKEREKGGGKKERRERSGKT